MKIHVIRFLAAMAALLLAWAAAAQDLPPDIAAALQRAGVPTSSVALLVAPVPAAGSDPQAGTEPLQPRLRWRADVPMNPASVMKLVTTSAALGLLGPAHFWKTRVETLGTLEAGTLHGDLVVHGSGDPKLVHERLEELLQAVRGKGVHIIDGDILLDRSVFNLPPHDPAAFDDEPLRPYNVGPDGFLVNFKALVFTFVPDLQRGIVRVESEPPIDGVAIPAQVPAAGGGCGNWRARLQADFSQPQRVQFAGSYPSSCGEREWGVAYPDPDNHAPRVMAAMWRAAGGQLRGSVRWLDAPVRGQPLVTGYSLPLSEIVIDINEYSNNVMAQQLFLTLSAGPDTPGGFAASRAVVQRWWQERFATHAAPIVDNGSGLSRRGRVSADALAALLQDAAAGPHGDLFTRSLPIAGVNGTARHLARRNPDSPAIGNARLKTGSLRDAAAIAGYAWGESGQQYAVVGLINHPKASAARPALDRLLEWAVRDTAH